MPDTLLSLFAARARTGALVAGTALATAALLGGGTVALQSVSSSAAVPAGTAKPDTGAADQGKAQGEQRRSDTVKAAKARRAGALAAPFVCDPSKTHGENVSAYVHTLPKGPGRGALVSAVAQSDCGKSLGDDDANDEKAGPQGEKSSAPGPAKAPADRPDKAEGPAEDPAKSIGPTEGVPGKADPAKEDSAKDEQGRQADPDKSPAGRP